MVCIAGRKFHMQHASFTRALDQKNARCRVVVFIVTWSITCRPSSQPQVTCGAFKTERGTTIKTKAVGIDCNKMSAENELTDAS